MPRATGTFEVKLAPIDNYEAVVGRLSIDKTFHGDMEGTSKGEMLAHSTSTKGSAGYVAMERVTGTLAGKSGSFVFQHSGSMNRAAPSLSVTVVPDSGTEELIGLSGSFNIMIDGKAHSYEFDYDFV